MKLGILHQETILNLSNADYSYYDLIYFFSITLAEIICELTSKARIATPIFMVVFMLSFPNIVSLLTCFAKFSTSQFQKYRKIVRLQSMFSEYSNAL